MTNHRKGLTIGRAFFNGHNFANSDELKDGTKVPDKMYKLLVWCENSEPKAEFILTTHEDESSVSIQINELHKYIFFIHQYNL